MCPQKQIKKMQGGCEWGKQAGHVLPTSEKAVINEPELISLIAECNVVI